MTDRPMLSLDIGTRKVAGLLTVAGPTGLQIVAAEIMEHATRSMYDGQIHDVVAVASVVEQVLQRLAPKADGPLTEAAVAAAGRALRTFTGTASQDLSGLQELTREQVFALELQAVQETQIAMAAALRGREEPQDYHYVGHSVMQARLDGLTMANLVGQRGQRAELDVIATFLPRGVVDSLQAVLSRVGLEMTGLTLEPIAALTVAVPPSMRHLNLVLVDIGAGTSDIAITRKGSIIAYDMVPTAGDEITEALSELYLLDFNVGEEVKRQIQRKRRISLKDILGQKRSLPAAEVAAALLPAVERLAGQIAERILALNGGAPQAILLVGGGSLTPGLPGALAAAVGLPDGRVAVRARDAIAGVEGAAQSLSGPEAVTPIGIAVAARNESTLGFHHVQVNEHNVRLFHPSRLTVADALLAAGVSLRDLQGRIGKGLTVTVNGRLQMIRGSMGRPPVILLNGHPASLESPVAHRDQIRVTPGTPGTPGLATVRDIAAQTDLSMTIRLNGEIRQVSPVISINGHPASAGTPLADNDVVIVKPVRTVGDLLRLLGYENPESIQTVRYSLDGAVQVARRPRYRIRIGGLVAGSESPVRDGDSLEVTELSPLKIRDVVDGAAARAAMRIKLNGRPVELAVEAPQLLRNDLPASPDEPLCENDALSLAHKAEPPMFAHLLAVADVSRQPPAGKTRLVMRLNGEPAEFITPVSEGDTAELIWE